MKKRSKLNLLLLILSFFAMLFMTSCKVNTAVEEVKGTSNSSDSSKIKVAASFNAMREFIEKIGGNKVEVHVMIPNGTEPHDFEPSAKDMQILSKARVFVYNGLGMESWADKTLKAVDNKSLKVVNASSGCDIIKLNSNDSKNEESYDPHVWLSVKMAKIQSNNIKKALIEVDPSNKEFYEKNYDDFSAELDNLYNEYSKKIASVSSKSIVTGHSAFAYLCRDFGLKQNSVSDVFAEGEPSPKKMGELVEFCKNNNVRTIFVENMVSTKVSETLAKEINGKAQKIYTLESKEDGKDYIQCMRENIEAIYESLK